MEQLKKCPFCGGEAELIGNRFFRVMCTECNAHIEDRETAIEVITAWNTRKPMELIVEQLEGCQEMVYEVKNQINDIYMERRICKEEYYKGRIHAYQRAIEIVKEEM